MLQRMLTLHVDEVAGLAAEKWSAGCSEYDLLDPVARFSHEALDDSGAFGADGNHRHPVCDCLLHHDVGGSSECLFVCESDGLANVYGLEGWSQSCITNNRCKHEVVAIDGCSFLEGLLSCKYFYVGRCERILHLGVLLVVGDDNHVGVELSR